MNPKTIQILIVDDDKELRGVLRVVLENRGYSILEAENGRKALKIVKNEDIQVVITDAQMPGGDGIELLKEIRLKDQSNPIVILMSGYSTISAEEAICLGAYACLAKPFSYQELYSLVDGCLSLPKAE